MKNYESSVEQLEFLSVKESIDKRVSAKRVDIIIPVPVTHTIQTRF